MLKRMAIVVVAMLVMALASGSFAGTTWQVYNSGDQTEGSVLADPAPPTDLLGVRLSAGAGTVNFTAANTYSGGTEVNAGIFRADHDSAAGTGGVTVGGSGQFRLHGPTVANNVTLADGGELYVSADSILNGDVDVTGTVTIGTTGKYADLTHNGAITGTGGVYFYGTNGNQWNGVFSLYGDGTYDGPTEVARGTKVNVYHANALGDGANAVTIKGGTGYGTSGYVAVRNAAGGLNANKSVRVEAISAGYRGSFQIANGVTIGNDITLAGGQLRKIYDGGSADTVVSGTITLEDGVAAADGSAIRSQLYHGSSGSSMGKMLINGTIQGTGGLVISGYDQRDCTFYINGDNTYQGGTLIHTTNYGTGSRVHVSTDTAFGTGPVELKNTYNTTYYQFVLDADCAMANDFTGTGRIDANGYTFTSTGSMGPGASIGTLDVNGALDFRGTYYWDYDGTDADLISADALAFGGGPCTVDVTWLGVGSPGAGDYVLFTYTGADPVITAPWTVTGDMGGSVWVDDLNNQVILTLGGVSIPEPGSAMLVLLGAFGLTRKRRRV